MVNHLFLSATILGLRVVTSAGLKPPKGVELSSPLAACSVYGDFTRSVHAVNNFCYVSYYETHVCLCI